MAATRVARSVSMAPAQYRQYPIQCQPTGWLTYDGRLPILMLARAAPDRRCEAGSGQTATTQQRPRKDEGDMTDGLLKSTNWAGKALSGTWKAMAGGVIDVMEPATGETLAQLARANAEDVAAACAAAAAAQPAWAAMPYMERA